jgi:hypothetical protein
MPKFISFADLSGQNGHIDHEKAAFGTALLRDRGSLSTLSQGQLAAKVPNLRGGYSFFASGSAPGMQVFGHSPRKVLTLYPCFFGSHESLIANFLT